MKFDKKQKKWLKKNKLWKKVKKETKKYNKAFADVFDDEPYVPTSTTTLDLAFEWECSKEGFEFWDGVHDTMWEAVYENR